METLGRQEGVVNLLGHAEDKCRQYRHLGKVVLVVGACCFVCLQGWSYIVTYCHTDHTDLCRGSGTSQDLSRGTTGRATDGLSWLGAGLDFKVLSQQISFGPSCWHPSQTKVG